MILQRLAVVEIANTLRLRDFLSPAIFEFFNTIGCKADWYQAGGLSQQMTHLCGPAVRCKLNLQNGSGWSCASVSGPCEEKIAPGHHGYPRAFGLILRSHGRLCSQRKTKPRAPFRWFQFLFNPHDASESASFTRVKHLQLLTAFSARQSVRCGARSQGAQRSRHSPAPRGGQ